MPYGAGRSLYYLVCIGEDISAANFTWAFAEHDGDPTILVLANAAPGLQGIHDAYDAGLVDTETRLTAGGTYIVAQIDETTLEGLLDPVVSSSQSVLRHTLYVTPAGGIKRVECFGTLTIEQGVPD